MRKKITCSYCSRRSICVKLCLPIEEQVGREEIKLRETPFSDMDHSNTERTGWPQNMTTTELIFIFYFYDRKTVSEIAKTLYVSRQYVTRKISYLRKNFSEYLEKLVVTTT